MLAVLGDKVPVSLVQRFPWAGLAEAGLSGSGFEHF